MLDIYKFFRWQDIKHSPQCIKCQTEEWTSNFGQNFHHTPSHLKGSFTSVELQRINGTRGIFQTWTRNFILPGMTNIHNLTSFCIFSKNFSHSLLKVKKRGRRDAPCSGPRPVLTPVLLSLPGVVGPVQLGPGSTRPRPNKGSFPPNRQTPDRHGILSALSWSLQDNYKYKWKYKYKYWTNFIPTQLVDISKTIVSE